MGIDASAIQLGIRTFWGSEKSLNLVHVTDLKKERKILIALTDDIEKKEAKALFFAIPFIIMAKCTSSPMLYICSLLATVLNSTAVSEKKEDLHICKENSAWDDKFAPRAVHLN